MTQKPHDISKKEITDVVYDTLMNNTGESYKHLSDFELDMQEVEAESGYIYFDIDTEKGMKRVHLTITIEDFDNQ